MRPKAKWVRVERIFFYFVISFGTLFLYTFGSPFCLEDNHQSRLVVIARLALACAAWDMFASACGVFAAAAIKRPEYTPVTAPLASALVAGLGVASIPFWIYQGVYRFMLKNTWADVSCFFAAGYGRAFPFVVAPILAAATLLCEWFIWAME